jgi:16S rRNA (uracil1498-N3)-methyltransferase
VVPELDGETLVLDAEATRHLRRSLRARPGDRIPVSDGRGTVAEAEVRGYRAARAEVRVGGRRRVAAPERRFWLAARAAAGRFDWLLEKAVELGAAGVWPLAGRPTPGPERRARWVRLVRAAGQQCLTAWLPDVAPASPLSHIVARAGAKPWGVLVVADPEGKAAGEVRAGDLPAGDHLLVVGPPEGFTAAERALLAGAGNALRLAFGPRRLRAETAALAALVWANGLGSGPGARGQG